MAARVQSPKRQTRGKTRGTAKRRRTTASGRRGKTSVGVFSTLFPLVIIAAILFCLGFLFLMGYRTATASTFFDAKTITVIGNSRVARGDIETIVRSQTEKNGVWNAELEQIKGNLEKIPYVKTAVVSRVLPDGVQIIVNERVPRIPVRLGMGDFWADDEAVILGSLGKNESRPAFVLRGWDETKSEKAKKDNQFRVQSFIKIQNDLQDAGIARNVNAVDLSDLQDVQATIQDSGASVDISLGREDFARRLKKALEVVDGKGQTIESLISHGSNVIAMPRRN